MLFDVDDGKESERVAFTTIHLDRGSYKLLLENEIGQSRQIEQCRVDVE
jgi:hypothetical protein